MADPAARLHRLVADAEDELVDTRRRLHRNPEVAHEERATAELAAARAEQLGYAVRTEVGGTGVVADLEGAGAGPTVMLRADMDALPISERGGDGRPAISERNGAMHACGHDGHVAMALVAARALAESRDAWSGRVRLCFQPAEEIAGGAQPMIDDGAMADVDAVFGIHLWSPLQVGRVAVTAGTLFGSADAWEVVVRGRGGHGGMPHTAVDPLPAAASLVTALQTIVSRETSPFAPAVVTVGRIEGGQAFNVIAEEVRMLGTVRAVVAEERERVIARIEEIAVAIARAHRCEATFERGSGCPPVVSDTAMAEVVRAAARATVGEQNVDMASPITVGDDVALFLQQAPGCYFLVGAGDLSGGRVPAPHHHPEFDIDERCLPVGAETLARSALAVLGGAGVPGRR
ncbi:MAG: M20 family metallopeptidase [Candidatus Dormibacteria bacterium]